MITNIGNSNVDSIGILRKFYLNYMSVIGRFCFDSIKILGIFYSYYSLVITNLLGLHQSKTDSKGILYSVESLLGLCMPCPLLHVHPRRPSERNEAALTLLG